jgi:hypothetical protein
MFTTEVYAAYVAAEAAYNSDSMNLDLMRVADAAFSRYMQEIKVAREKFESLPDCLAKDSAITNAYDTEGTDKDELYWFEIALRTFDLMIDEPGYGVAK